MIVYPTTVVGEECVSGADLRKFLVIDADLHEDDALLQRMVRAAREKVESDLARAGNFTLLGARDFIQRAHYWPVERWIDLKRAPVTKISAVKYEIGVDTVTFDPDLFYFDQDQARVVLLDGVWPAVELGLRGYWVEFTAGFTNLTVPMPLRQAVLLLASHFYQNREAVVASTQYRAEAVEVPLGYRDLVAPYLVRRF